MSQRLRQLLPSFADYGLLKTTWRGDLLAGVTVGVVALPLALGFGVSSGLTPAQGLVTAIVAGLIAAIFGGSHVQISGPTGAMAVVLLPIVASHGASAVASVAIMAGVMVLLGGVLGLGRAVSVIPWPVIEGFTLGIAVIIALQQVPLLAEAGGVDQEPHSSNAVVAAAQSLWQADPMYLLWAAGAAGIVVVCMLVIERVNPKIPGSLIGIAVVTVLAALLPTPLAVIGEIPAALPTPGVPDVSPATLTSLLGPAAAVAALAAVESLLSARVAASMADTGRYRPDRELVGQGMASIGSGLFGGMPATGAIARTAVNVRSGGRSRLAGVVHALLLLLVVLLIARPVELVPLAALGGVLLLTAWRMVSRTTVTSVIRSTRADAIAFILTALVTVSFDLIVAVGIGVLVAGIFTIRNLAQQARVEVEQVPGPPVAGDESIAVVRLDGPIIFASADRVQDLVVDDTHETLVVILRMSRLELLDATGARVLSEIVRTLERRGITVLIKGIQPRHADLMRDVGVLRALRHHRHLFADLTAAVDHARSHVRRSLDLSDQPR
ncbi:MAG TPA: SulP family inorganic anion transporter [Candidatus Nesterenkonia stercoripullorum]|uniref:SulP family inorganic anion transporter n=1 Tax=Candidatus Nesterenkonia stercoripullorum TaxID=2838701 RepID=A0A9D1UUD6_9MICC|nr:SulP family inorganic anion transporter [Candidatus Nesterenkonia stercoripullorum]